MLSWENWNPTSKEQNSSKTRRKDVVPSFPGGLVLNDIYYDFAYYMMKWFRSNLCMVGEMRGCQKYCS